MSVCGEPMPVPAMSRCAQGVSLTKRFRNCAAVIDPASRPPVFFMSANWESICLSYSLPSGMRQTRSPVASPAAESRAASASSFAEHAGIIVAEGDDDGAGQGRKIDHELRLEAFFCVGERVGKHEAAFRVGVDDLDGLAGHGGDDVAGALRIAVGMFSTMPMTPTALTLALRAASACIRPMTAAAPAMSPFMSSMPPAGLIEMPPVSKTTPLPTKATGCSLAGLRSSA